MARWKKLLVVTLCALCGVLVLVATGVVRVSTGVPRKMDERGADEWRLKDGNTSSLSDRSEKLRLMHPVLRHALVQATAARTQVAKLGTGEG